MKKMPIYEEHKDRSKRIQSAITAIEALLPLNLYLAHKKELISVCIWKITEADGKAKVRYWSNGAITDENGKLIHEHVYERKELISILLSGEAVKSVTEDAVACMVTDKEHTKLTRSTSNGCSATKMRGSRYLILRSINGVGK